MISGTLQSTADRLARGSKGRTEAEIQADVRAFILGAPLELEAAQVLDVALEAQVSGGRRIDVEAGCAVIEVKKSLRSSTELSGATVQLAGYVRERVESEGQRYVGVLTDGQTWILFHLTPQGVLAEVGRFALRSGDDALALSAWLEAVLTTRLTVKPTPREIVRRLGAESPGAQLDLADLRALYAACRSDPEVQLKRTLWARLLLSALGTNFDDSDELFVTHTYLVLTAELIAHEVMGIPLTAPARDVRSILEGQQFELAGLRGVVEADFFDWPATTVHGGPIVAGIARRLAAFDWTSVEHDVLKALYESVIDADTRKRLGEYYTPDWLAEKIVNEQMRIPLEQRVLDPACGSGTFLFWAVRRLLEACDEAGIPNRAAIQRVASQVQGMDLHPVAVTLARVTYLLALSPARLADRDDLTVPIFLGDSVRWSHDDVILGKDGIRVRTSNDLEFFADELHFPESVVENPERFDRLVADLAARASHRKRNTKPPSITGLLNRHHVVGADDRDALVTAFQKLCRLHDGHQDHVWSYYIRNRARPISFARRDGQADVLVGNPPWLAYRHMTHSLQQDYRALAKMRGLWAGGKVATHQDLSDVFVAEAVDRYLKPGGQFAFVMPFAVLSRRQFAGFRTGDWGATHDDSLDVRLAQPEDFARVKPPPFPMPASVISGTKAKLPSPLPSLARVWTGRVNGHFTDWPTASSGLDSAIEAIETAADVAESPYRSRFTQGATLVPRMLVTVTQSDAPSKLGLPAGRIAISSARSSLEKRPWIGLPTMTGVVESEFIRPMHLGATILAYRPRTPRLAVVPWLDGHLLTGDDDRLDEFPGLASWWRAAEQLWDEHKSRGSKLSLSDQINFQGKLAKQFPLPRHRVVYTKSGQHLAACRIDDTSAVIDHKLYWAAANSITEARYLTAVLNSQPLTDAVAPLQARGQHNPRDFDMHVFALPFPEFDPQDQLHMELVELAAYAETVAANVDIDDSWKFEKSRRITRESLQEEGIAYVIDEAVAELLLAALDNAPATPDLLSDLAAAQARASEMASRRRSRPSRMPTSETHAYARPFEVQRGDDE